MKPKNATWPVFASAYVMTDLNAAIAVKPSSDGRIFKQAGRRLDSAPVSDVVALAAKVGPAGRPKHIWSIWHTRRLMGDFVEK